MTLLALCLLAAQGGQPAQAQTTAQTTAQTAVDVELVIAIDSSASIDSREFALQMAGIAAAFRDPEVVAAITSGPESRVAVAAIFWTESGYPVDVSPWHVLADAADADPFGTLVFVIVSLEHPDPYLRAFRILDGDITDVPVAVDPG